MLKQITAEQRVYAVERRLLERILVVARSAFVASQPVA